MAKENHFDIHGQEKKLRQRVELIRRSGKLSPQSKESLLAFTDHCFAEGLSRDRVIHYLQILQSIGEKLENPFKEAGKEDIVNFVAWLERSDYSDWTKHDYKVSLKKFYRWLGGGEDYPEEVRWIKTTMKRKNNKLPEELLTEQDVSRLIEAADHPRDKALVSVLYESGCRVSELLSLRIRSISFDKYGAVIIVAGKTGMRRVRLIASAPHLSTWVNTHPLRNDPGSPLWVGISTTNKNQPLNYSGARKLLRVLGRRAGLKKPLNPHIFRHSRATHLANVLTEAQMDQQFGWVQGSDIPSTYVHLSGRDVDRTLLSHYGLQDDEGEEESALKPKRCPRCRQLNSYDAKFCGSCGCPLDLVALVEIERERHEADRLMSQLIEDDQVKQLLLEKIRELGLENAL